MAAGRAAAIGVLGGSLLTASKGRSYTLSLVFIFSGINQSFMSALHGWCQTDGVVLMSSQVHRHPPSSKRHPKLFMKWSLSGKGTA